VDDILDSDETEIPGDNDIILAPENTEASIEAQIAALQAKLEALKAARAKERLEAGASQGVCGEGEVCEDKPQWAVVRIKYPDDTVVEYHRVGVRSSAVG